jgi:hypothetical protein
LKELTEASTAPTFPTLTLKGPNTNSSDSHAQLTKNTITSFNAGFAPTYVALLTTVNPTQSGDTWTWSLVQGTLTVTTTATKQNDGSYMWSVKLNGTDPYTDSTYNNWVAITGTSTSDKKSGNFNTYARNTTVVIGNVVWSTDANGKLTATFTSYGNGLSTGKGVVVNNSDDSGELDLYTGSVVTYKSTWVASGAGTWWTYDSTGTQTGTGTWS